MKYDFFSRLSQVINNEESSSVFLCGNIYDLFFDGKTYVPIIDFLKNKWKTGDRIFLTYEINQPIRFSDYERMKIAWTPWKGTDKKFDDIILETIHNTTTGLELLRQLTICARDQKLNLIILVESADLILPAGNTNVSSLSTSDRTNIRIVSNWICDPLFQISSSTVIFITESKFSIHPSISRLPQMLSVEVPAPDYEQRLHFLTTCGMEDKNIAQTTACLSIYSLKQLVASKKINTSSISSKVEEYLNTQLGEDVVEFKRPAHRIDDLIGFSSLKKFLKEEFIPRLKAGDDSSLTGAIISGPLGSGKTFIFEAVAAELEIPILVLKNIRSQWFGQTDAIFEKLRRVLESLNKVIVFIDEADTQFGGVGNNVHETERRLTGKLQSMMSDSKLKGRVHWLLMTARVHMLSPDIRRPGRAGDLIIPIFDPQGEDRIEFIKWTFKPVLDKIDDKILKVLDEYTNGYSSASFASLRSTLKSKPAIKNNTLEIIKIVKDIIFADIVDTRRYQTLQALLNCTRLSLIPPDELEGGIKVSRIKWVEELKKLEQKGIV